MYATLVKYVHGVNMATTITHLRQNIFSEIDKVIETGQSIEIERKGHMLKIVLEEKKLKLSSLIKRNNVIKCSDDDLIYNDWLKEWKHDASDD
ncbi:putative type II toxin-antitoxin system Phd/YefM family antitoxin [Candidatus Megaera venefica]|jgi:hypothetical protein|uniref:Type II toxin-antitoxin system Phd/YefM family antitoxin n=1 Tax=Candidatus Megaera venefica TaxID=2055910 RepID=A0ABU5ND48_9RICK|nr:hypothetical protein [Candidatus Megaera venefica]MEA0971075.1 putative type II toxin-antitoxin system Phd/YefM family antitoxin [Candidatus Megaera venefica]